MLISCTILCGVVLGLMNVWATHARATDRAQNLLVASNLLQQVLESESAQGFKAAPIWPKVVVNMKRIVDSTETDMPYEYWVDVVDTSTPTGPALKNVTVYVTWKEKGEEHMVRGSTLIYWQS